MQYVGMYHAVMHAHTVHSTSMSRFINLRVFFFISKNLNNILQTEAAPSPLQYITYGVNIKQQIKIISVQTLQLFSQDNLN